jgi:katanin p80 WD40 repeat-containing subunit B1
MAAKLQEFVAHGSAVNCLQFGRKSGAVMVTGGEDKKVNVWAIGRPNAILSLTGHTSSVECVTFDSNESTVIAGSAGGTLKLWDLEQAKVARTLTGHRSNCISVQVYSDSEQCLLLAVVQRAFSCLSRPPHDCRSCSGVHSPQWHPYGEFFASGSVDTNLKIWDIRRKSCIQTYKGHTRGVRQIAFSPDGRWVVSGGDDGVVKLWDLTAGR